MLQQPHVDVDFGLGCEKQAIHLLQEEAHDPGGPLLNVPNLLLMLKKFFEDSKVRQVGKVYSFSFRSQIRLLESAFHPFAEKQNCLDSVILDLMEILIPSIAHILD